MRRRGTSPGLPSIRLLQLTTFVSTLDRFVMPPMLVAIAADFDAPLASLVQVAGAYFLAYGLMQPAWGMITDRFGLVRTLRISLVLAAIATTSAAFTTSALALGCARALAGVAFGAAYPASLIYIGDTIAPRLRQREIARLMVGVAVGTSLGSAGAGVVAHTSSWRFAFLVTGVAALALAVALHALPEPTTHRRHTSLWEPVRSLTRSKTTMVVLFLKAAMAAIPAAILIAVIYSVVLAVLAEMVRS